MTRLVIDTDPGVDDAHALMAVLSHPDVQVHAVTTVAGNVSLERTTANACSILDAMDSDVPVFAGCERAIIAPSSEASEFHGLDGLGDVITTPSTRPVAREHAVNALVRMGNEAPGELTLLAIGPLTNVALATRLNPELPEKYARLVVMGGAIRGMGNATPAAEFNMHADPEAASIVFQAWPQLTLVSWETTLAHSFTPEQVRALLSIDSPRAAFFRQISRSTLAFIERFTGQRSLLEPDLLAAAVAADRGILLGAEHHYIEIELAGKAVRGQTTVDWYDRTEHEANVELVLEMDTERVFEMTRTALT